MKHDPLSDALSVMQNAETVGKPACEVPNTKLVKAVLEVLKVQKYIESFKAGPRKIAVEMTGRINRLRVVRPRFPAQKGEFEKFEKRYLPSRDIGMIIVSTSKGVMSHREAQEKRIGGRLLAFVY